MAVALDPAEGRLICLALAEHPELCLDGATQRGGPEAPQAERAERLAAMLAAQPTRFLRQHGRLLRPVDLAFFEPLLQPGPSGRPPPMAADLAELLEELRERLADPAARKSSMTKNRRYNHLRTFGQSEYFGNEAMAARRPALYEQHVSRLLPGDGGGGGGGGEGGTAVADPSRGAGNAGGWKGPSLGGGRAGGGAGDGHWGTFEGEADLKVIFCCPRAVAPSMPPSS